GLRRASRGVISRCNFRSLNEPRSQLDVTSRRRLCCVLSQGLRNESLKSGGWKGDLADDDSQWSQCVVDGVRDRGRDWHGASLAGAFNALGIERGRRFDVPDADERNLPGGRKEVVEVSGGQSLP